MKLYKVNPMRAFIVVTMIAVLAGVITILAYNIGYRDGRREPARVRWV